MTVKIGTASVEPLIVEVINVGKDAELMGVTLSGKEEDVKVLDALNRLS